MVVSIIVPMALGGLRLAIRDPSVIFWEAQSRLGNILIGIFTFLTSPFHIMILALKKYKIELELYTNPTSEPLLKKWDEIHCHESMQTKLELGLESVLQLCLQILLILYASTETKTTEGLSQIFKEKLEFEGGTQDYVSWIKGNKEIMLFYAFNLWSLVSCIRSHIAGLSARRTGFPFLSKLVVSFYALMSITTRLLAIIMFFSPSLGLFNILRHLQGEQFNWHPVLIEHLIEDKTVTFEGISPIQVDSIFNKQSINFL